jgi:hypothetical protein
MARQALYDAGGRPLMIRAEPLERIDQLGEALGLLATQGVRKGKPDRPAVIDIAVAAVIEQPDLVERLRAQVEIQTAEREEAQAASPRRRARLEREQTTRAPRATRRGKRKRRTAQDATQIATE